jgi:ribose-phosphate pyrophosphokinase
MRSGLVFFFGNSNPLLAQRVCSCLDLAPGKALVGRFSDGEVRVELGQGVRGLDVYVFQSTCPPVNDNLIELMVLMDAIKRASARRVNLVIPYYGYGRQDQKDKPRVSLTSRMVADMLSVAGASRVIAIDLHSAQIQGFFDIPVDNLSGTEILLKDLRKSLRGDEIVVAPDAGGVQRARTFASKLKVDLAIMDYRGRSSSTFSCIVGDVRNRRVIILDDMVDTGDTIVRAAEGVKAAGADLVDAYCVHAILSQNAIEMIESSPLGTLTVTDTIPLHERAIQSSKIRTVSIAEMLAEAIRRVHMGESLNSLFEEF